MDFEFRCSDSGAMDRGAAFATPMSQATACYQGVERAPPKKRHDGSLRVGQMHRRHLAD